MDLQEYLDNAIASRRKESFDNSDQLSLGELILKIEPIINKGENLEEPPTVVYDFTNQFPTHIDSWRGVYAELALNHTTYDSGGDTPMNIVDFLEMLKQSIGKEFTGYKGGEFTMSEDTPIWVANYGDAGSTAVIDVVDNDYEIIIITGLRES